MTIPLPKFRIPRKSKFKERKGEYTWVDGDAVYFFLRNIANTDWSFGLTTTPVNDRSKLVTTAGTGRRHLPLQIK